MSGRPALPLSVRELSGFLGVPAARRIREEFLPAVDEPRWRDLAEEFMRLDGPATAYAHPWFTPMPFEACPGSGAHHAHVGGLALHVLQDLENAKALLKVHASRGLPARPGLVYAAILLHDAMKRFVYRFNERFELEKSEDPFIGRNEDHHSWVLRELTARNADRELLLAVAAMHGLDDVTLAGGVRPLAVVNHYLSLSGSGLTMTADDVRPEHVIGFLSDSDWPASGAAQARCRALAGRLAPGLGLGADYVLVHLGSRLGFERADAVNALHGPEEVVRLAFRD
ncbi:hypothetical protein NNJEOMEG_01272 [Fundidesulfovibrio magnetotacticus]|uniref:HD domain-containing protein n=1 Tax=Fundidesulfovibrio magnetotacticus TaxID=2730080 RepID=A0A6V8LR34_9BACT|nr:hypothetical protein [Fundidesulfovibrio magnetotacticus]GFK93440.1 hypothetical protein NNJEOMEG_01272 [Fundidesulfovibrio magnetotacticus]